VFRLRPAPETNRIFIYCLALACEKTGVLVHAACVMSNHHHLVLTDPHGLLPDFLREFHRLTAKAMNGLQGQWENLWASEPCNVVRLATDEDVDDKITYVMANPVSAGLVRRPEEWPGIRVWGVTTLRAQRPTSYFRKDGACPPELTLALTRPPARSAPLRSDARWRTDVIRAIAAATQSTRRSFATQGRAFLGRAAVLATSIFARALSSEPRRGVVPTFAARLRSVRDEIRAVERRFRARYRAALDLWRAGLRTVAFPHGTWLRRIEHGVIVEPASA
jgi:REP element-mobilizing transposase RayT